MIDISVLDEVELPEDAEKFIFNDATCAISDGGRVFKFKRTKHYSRWVELSTYVGSANRRRFSISDGGRVRSADVAKTMLAVLIGDQRGREWLVDFLDDDKENLTLDNLCWRRNLGAYGKGEKEPIDWP